MKDVKRNEDIQKIKATKLGGKSKWRGVSRFLACITIRIEALLTEIGNIGRGKFHSGKSRERSYFLRFH